MVVVYGLLIDCVSGGQLYLAVMEKAGLCLWGRGGCGGG